MDSATSGDQVMLDPGIFTIANQGTALDAMVVMKRGVDLVGCGSDASIIDAGHQARILFCRDVGSVSISEISFRRGFQDVVSPEGNGGGILSVGDSKLTISRCVFEENYAQLGNSGGGVACQDGGSTVLGCDFRNNVGAYSSRGAGAYIVGGVIRECTFENNRTVGEGAIAAGLLAVDTLIEDSVFKENTCTAINGAAGGAIELFGGVIKGCTFIGNEVRADPYGHAAAGAIQLVGETEVSDSVFIQNKVTSIGLPGKGGAICHAVGNSVVISNCTFVGNVATYLYPTGPGTPVGAIFLGEGGTIRNCIIVGTGGAPCEGPRSHTTMRCTNLFENSLGDDECGFDPTGSNFSQDPLFCSDPLLTNDVSISEDSPCSPEQSNCGLIGAGKASCASVEVTPMQWGDIKRIFGKD